jgi:hypothetical protein
MAAMRCLTRVLAARVLAGWGTLCQSLTFCLRPRGRQSWCTPRGNQPCGLAGSGSTLYWQRTPALETQQPGGLNAAPGHTHLQTVDSKAQTRSSRQPSGMLGGN